MWYVTEWNGLDWKCKQTNRTAGNNFQITIYYWGNKVLCRLFPHLSLSHRARVGVDVVVRLALVLMMIFILLACVERRRPNKSASFSLLQTLLPVAAVVRFHRHWCRLRRRRRRLAGIFLILMVFVWMSGTETSLRCISCCTYRLC